MQVAIRSPHLTRRRSMKSHSMYLLMVVFIGISSSVLDFIYHTNKLLDLEKEAEAEEASLSSKNFRYVEVQEYTVGCNGKCNVKLTMKSGSSSKVVTDFAKVGESINLKIAESSEKKETGEAPKVVKGVISTVTEKFLIATMDEFLDEWYEANKLLMNKVLDEVTFKRLDFALKHLEHAEKTPAASLVNFCFKPRSDEETEILPRQLEDREVDEMSFFSTKLNDSQKEAIKFALKSNDMALILGPPGTGKVCLIGHVFLTLYKDNHCG